MGRPANELSSGKQIGDEPDSIAAGAASDANPRPDPGQSPGWAERDSLYRSNLQRTEPAFKSRASARATGQNVAQLAGSMVRPCWSSGRVESADAGTVVAERSA